MIQETREAKLSAAFVKIADTLVADFDLVDMLQTLIEICTDILDVDAAGLLLRAGAGDLQVVASTTEDARFIEFAQLGAAAGPCWECANTGLPVTIPDIAADGDQWPTFRDVALERGFRSVHATPLRLRSEVIGTMNLFSAAIGALNAQDIAVAQALSDVAAISILSQRAAQERDTVTAQLQVALETRVVIEQAKGILAHSLGISVDAAFASLRTFARDNNLNLRAVAAALVDRRLSASSVVKNNALRGAPASASHLAPRAR